MLFHQLKMTRFVLCATLLLAALFEISYSNQLIAQTIPGLPEKKTEKGKKEKKKVDPELEKMLRSQRSTFETFITAINSKDRAKAADCLDLSGLPSEAKAGATDLAYQLKEVIDRLVYIDFNKISDDPDETNTFRLDDFLDDDSDAAKDAKLITIVRGPDKLWRFSKETVASIESLHARWKDADRVENVKVAPEPFSEWLRKKFPKSLQNRHFLFADYLWVCLGVIIFLGFLADLLTRTILNSLTKAWFKFAKSKEDFQAQKNLWKPVGLLAQAMVWFSFTSIIGLPVTALLVVRVALKFLTVLAAIWTAFRLIDMLARFMQDKASLTETKFDDLLIPMVSKSLKVLTVCVGIIMCAEAFDLPLTGLIGGLGLGGMAFVFASKDAISNLFGSLTVLIDRPFEVGDWVITEGIEGTVEDVGFRSTRVRTFYNSLITVPNSRLTTASVDNLGKRQFRRMKSTLGVQYDTTPEQIDAFCEGVRELIRRHPYTRKDYYHVYLNAFSGSSLDIMLYCFFECPDWSVELREKHRLMNDIIRLAQSLKVSFAFPTQTLHMFKEEHSSDQLPKEMQQAEQHGRAMAAQIAGPLLEGDKRPGLVSFDPTLEAGTSGADDGE